MSFKYSHCVNCSLQSIQLNVLLLFSHLNGFFFVVQAATSEFNFFVVDNGTYLTISNRHLSPWKFLKLFIIRLSRQFHIEQRTAASCSIYYVSDTTIAHSSTIISVNSKFGCITYNWYSFCVQLDTMITDIKNTTDRSLFFNSIFVKLYTTHTTCNSLWLW